MSPLLAELPVDRILKTLRTRRQGPLLTIELNAPEQGNAVNDAMLDDLLTVLDGQDPAVRVVVLAAAGRDFCLGGDRVEFSEHLAHDPTGSGIRASGVRAQRVCDALTSNPAVTIARVQGRAIGAGFALALACDLRVGADTATFRLPELALGLPTAWGGLLPRLVNEVGAARVREIVLTGRPVRAHEARHLSILQNIVAEDALDAAVMTWAEPLLRRSAAALRVTKTLLHSLTASTRLADVSALDPELMAAVVAEVHHTGRSRPPG
ncbi:MULTISPECIES: enoyl-CoA hydratase/isomerase family protein [Streptomyces]|uniref:Enoyl-CoA hydratase/isomerase family protein n=2 Tax=Streptomyces viridosporus TaxID=67581 RepID=A0ABX6AA77_STRVD|nr:MULTISPECIES: enoyl-CoA hydratase/isomerase family protein [Streptomyces]EFE71376.1 enoyl-CoA hydratase/isomerase [Streptomyces viridosporus ATCC 14672]PWJ08188.1 enoyl-CoA hydratase/isomerase family protein [Streptomyces sp. NWU49]QEU84053.1 enoyl-CoA hydratase/isomerase family protein [Streptomyces viridosporus T7A]